MNSKSPSFRNEDVFMGEAKPSRKLTFWALTALVVGSMLDAGIFSLPTTFARATGVLGAVISWGIAGAGMLMLAFIFQNLARRKPDLDTGPFAYAREGFGNYPAFFAAFGFWAGSCIGSVSYFVLIKSTLSVFFPALGYGNTPLAIFFASIGIWIVHFLILRGIYGANAINMLATTFKVLIVIIFVFFVAGAYQEDIFAANFWGGTMLPLPIGEAESMDAYGYVGHAAKDMVTFSSETLFEQVRRTMLVAAYVFIGVEGASIYSRYAKRKEDVGLSTMIGFLTVLFLFITVTVIAFGVLERHELAGLRQPSMAEILSALGRSRGALFVRIGLVITVLGAFLAWVLLAVEMLFAASLKGVVPKVISHTNHKGTPVVALWATTLLVQVFLLITLFSSYAYGFALEMTSALSRMPYLLVAAYAFKLCWTGETYNNKSRMRKKDMIVAIIAAAYLLLVLWAGGLKFVLLTALIYAPGTIFFIIARRELGLPVFTTIEKFLFGLTSVLAGLAVYNLYTGGITI